jgi:GNAT superfamily N-acetyltransferase
MIREMATGEEEEVAAMVRSLARETVSGIEPQLTAQRLAAARDLVDVVVAECDNALVGACLMLMTYSTWRGARGAYVVDLFVSAGLRGHKVGERLLSGAASRARERGATFVKLEVDARNDGATRFYERLGFRPRDADRHFVLEQDNLDYLISGKDQP